MSASKDTLVRRVALPDLARSILTGVSAGGIIATCVASREGRFGEAIDRLDELWRGRSILARGRSSPSRRGIHVPGKKRTDRP